MQYYYPFQLIPGYILRLRNIAALMPGEAGENSDQVQSLFWNIDDNKSGEFYHVTNHYSRRPTITAQISHEKVGKHISRKIDDEQSI